MGEVINAKGLIREYESVKGMIKKERIRIEALKGVSFEVQQGEIFGLLGPNGAGKTTTIKILTTLLAPTAGEAEVLGFNVFKDAKELRKHINFIFGGERGLYWRLTAKDNLNYFSDLYGVDKRTRAKRLPELLEMVGLQDRADEKVEAYSKGMKQRLQIARGLINDPKVIFLDEPTIGLDPVGARDLRNIIRMLSGMGKTILLTTHYMYEADELCSRIAVINAGEILALDTPERLKNMNMGLSVLEVCLKDIEKKDIHAISGMDGVDAVNLTSSDHVSVLRVHCAEPYAVLQKVMNLLRKYSVTGLNIRQATLEDAYIKMVGGNE